VVTLDLGLPPDAANASEGLATLSEILERSPHTKVIVVTGNEDREVALHAVSRGAYDFYQKPIDPDVLALMSVNPFAQAPPKYLRVQVFRYQFTTPVEREQTGDWWKRTYLGQFPYVEPRRP